MGKRKSKARVMKKVVATVPKIFDCPFCNNKRTVECAMDRSTRTGTIRCRICGADFQMVITNLTEPVDIYSEWIDEAEKINANPGQDDDLDYKD